MKQSLVYDLQEPYRWIADVAVVEAFEFGVLDLPDFHFTGDDYRYRFEPEAKRRFLDLLREHFNSGVEYNGGSFKWDTVIEHKTMELGRYLVGRTGRLDFSEPSPNLYLALSQQEARRLGIGKSTLHYLRASARDRHPLKVYQRVRGKLQNPASAPVQGMS
jgi:CRISPR-associated protein Cas1